MVLAGLLIVLSTLAGRVVYLQTYGRQQTIERAERQHYMMQSLQARRGNIWDSTGMIIAGSVQTHTLFVDPKFLLETYQVDTDQGQAELNKAAVKLAEITDQDPSDIKKLILDNREKRFIKLAEHLNDNLSEAARKLRIAGVGLVPSSERTYPMGSLAAHLIGGVGADGKGLEGIELKFNNLLAGHDGVKRSLKDARRHPLYVMDDNFTPPEHGKNLVLTIDANIQMIVEQELAAACEKYKAQRGEAVVMNPYTGEVVALANWPTFNPQNLNDSRQEDRLNRAVAAPFEVGSTIKPFIVGPALHEGVTRLDEVWPIKSVSYKSPLRRKPITDVHHYGQLTTWDVLVKSSNIGMTMIGERLQKKRLYNAITGFGFGRRSGIDLPGEDPGLVNPLSRWRDYSIPSVSQGYEMMATPLQLARAMCTYANGGYLITPHVIKGVLDDQGNTLQRYAAPDPRLLPHPIDAQTAIEIRRVLCDVVVRGTSTGARSNIWNVFGKTGTSHISEGKAGYSTTRYNSSFVGGAPAEQPRLVIALTIHEPDRSLGHYGGTVSGPAAGRVLERSLAYLKVPASPDLPEPPAHIAAHLVNFNPNIYHRRPNRPILGTTASTAE